MEVKTGNLHFAAYSIVAIAAPLPKLSALLCKKAAISGALPNVSNKGLFQRTVILTVFNPSCILTPLRNLLLFCITTFKTSNLCWNLTRFEQASNSCTEVLLLSDLNNHVVRYTAIFHDVNHYVLVPQTGGSVKDSESLENNSKYTFDSLSRSFLLFPETSLHLISRIRYRRHKYEIRRINSVTEIVKPRKFEAGEVSLWTCKRERSNAYSIETRRPMHNVDVVFCSGTDKVHMPYIQIIVTY
jgi:hypothetical protein